MFSGLIIGATGFAFNCMGTTTDYTVVALMKPTRADNSRAYRAIFQIDLDRNIYIAVMTANGLRRSNV